MRNLQEFSILGGWCILWLIGGVGIARYAFRISNREQLLTGIALGMVVETWLANLLTLVFPAVTAFWLAAGLTLAIGIIFSWGTRPGDWLKISFPWGQIICFAILVYIFTPYHVDWLFMMIMLICQPYP